MISNRIRALVGMSLMAGSIGLAAFGAVGTANAAPSTPLPTGSYTCYDYATQIFYTCYY
ncbi:hypothetical protein [Mycobacterium asiaticum]|uniref:hypothetical protein n=1 Tax=Mycobacterium asiaticum TaxID=1790 RepID=UPI000A9FB5E7|nr:hypothetical protein [Mycobacterium asiaticum]